MPLEQTEKPKIQQKTKRLVAACPKCYKKLQPDMYRKTSNTFRCRTCKTVINIKDIIKRDAGYFNHIIGYRKINKRIVHEVDGKELYESVKDEVPRIRRGKRQFDESMIEKFNRDQLIIKINEVLNNPEVIYNTNINYLKKTIRDMAFISFLFLTGARVSEVIGLPVTDPDTGHPIKPLKYELPPINKRQITKFMQPNNPDLMWKVSNLPVLKRRNETKYNPEEHKEYKVYPRRDVIIPVKFDKELISIIDKWLSYIEEGKPVFSFTRRRASQICYYFHAKYNHFWRHIRATDLATRFNFNPIQQQHFFGWSTSKMADRYSHLQTTNLINSMYVGYQGEKDVKTPEKSGDEEEKKNKI
jgi:integrase